MKFNIKKYANMYKYIYNYKIYKYIHAKTNIETKSRSRNMNNKQYDLYICELLEKISSIQL